MCNRPRTLSVCFRAEGPYSPDILQAGPAVMIYDTKFALGWNYYACFIAHFSATSMKIIFKNRKGLYFNR